MKRAFTVVSRFASRPKKSQALGQTTINITNMPLADSKGFRRLDYPVRLACGPFERIFPRKPSENTNIHLNFVFINRLHKLLIYRPAANGWQVLENALVALPEGT